MKSTFQTVGFILFSIFMLVIFPSSCTGNPIADRSAYTRQDFDARICGELDGERIEGVLSSRPDVSGDAIRASYRFEMPATLNGMTVSINAEGDVSVLLGDMSSTAEGLSDLAVIMYPVIEMGEEASVQKCDGGRILVRVCDDNCDLEYVFAEDGAIPLNISGKYKGRTINFSLSEADATGS